MALRVWLPLNGNLENQGLSPAMIEAVTTPVYVDGKIGKCLSEGKIKIPAEYVGDIFNNEHMSICFWYNNNTDSTSGNHAICGFSGNGEGDTGAVRIWDFYNYSTPNNFHWSMGTLGGGSLSNVLPANTWVHIAATFDGSKVRIYINGVEQANNNASSAYTFDKSYYISFGRTPQKLNDFRIYDECLSPKRIKEISKGLVAHYKLEGLGAGENLLTNSQLIASNAGKPSNSDQLTYCNSVTSYSYDNNEKCWKLVTPSSGNQNNGIGFSFPTADTTLGLKHGDFITFSCDVKGESDENIPALGLWMNFKSTDTNWWQGTYHFTLKQVLTDLSAITFKRYSITFQIPPDNPNYDGFKLWTTIHGNYGSTLYVKNVKLEVGNKPTGWIPNKNDSLYTILGYDKILLTDVSGNGYTATNSETLAFNSDSLRYSGSTKFNGNTSYLAIGRPMPTDGLTVNIWAYMDNWANYNARLASCTEGGGWNFEPMSGAMNFALGVGTSSNVYMTNFTSSQTPLSGLTSGWHMFTGTFDGIYKRIYIDGVLKGETNGLQNGTTLTTTTPIFYNGSNGIFIGAEAGGSATTPVGNYFNGLMSDFRIYSTALSAGDIKELYQTSAIIDNQGNAYAYEFKEE